MRWRCTRQHPLTKPRQGAASRRQEGHINQLCHPTGRSTAEKHALAATWAETKTFFSGLIEELRVLLNGISRQAVDKRVGEGTLLAVPGPGGARRFPTAQFDGHGGVVRGLREVRQALGFKSPWAVLNFLVNGNDNLGGRRPVDVLQQGDMGPVVTAAASIGVQGA